MCARDVAICVCARMQLHTGAVSTMLIQHLGENGKEVINQNAGYIMTVLPMPSTPNDRNQDFK